MRQAGRYHSHYQQLKEKYSFEELCKVPELAAEVACGPVEEFDFDVSILFSDILFPLDYLGMSLKFNPGPIFEKNLSSKIDNLNIFWFISWIITMIFDTKKDPHQQIDGRASRAHQFCEPSVA